MCRQIEWSSADTGMSIRLAASVTSRETSSLPSLRPNASTTNRSDEGVGFDAVVADQHEEVVPLRPPHTGPTLPCQNGKKIGGPPGSPR